MYMGEALKKKNAVYLCMQAHFEPSKTHYACMADSGFFLDYESGPQPPRFPEYGVAMEETSFFAMPFYSADKSRTFAKTGSGQTQEKLEAEAFNFCRLSYRDGLGVRAHEQLRRRAEGVPGALRSAR